MQKIITVNKYSSFNSINDEYLDKGWCAKQIVTFNECLVILIEKETRKEKLSKLDDINDK